MCSQFGNTAVLDKFTTKMDEARKKKLQVSTGAAGYMQRSDHEV